MLVHAIKTKSAKPEMTFLKVQSECPLPDMHETDRSVTIVVQDDYQIQVNIDTIDHTDSNSLDKCDTIVHTDSNSLDNCDTIVHTESNSLDKNAKIFHTHSFSPEAHQLMYDF